jgi:type VI secretion system secreted protein Hcp
MKIVKNAVLLSLVVGAAAVAADANAALTAYVKFTGQKQGAINGSVTTKQFAGDSLVFGIDLDTQVPADVSTGQATGKRQHSPFIVVKPIDAASPRIYSAMANNEKLTKVVVDVTGPDTQGKGVTTLFSYTLTEAQSVDLHHSMTTPCVGSAPCKATGPDGNIVGPDEPTESIAMTYKSITITYVNGGVTATDDWNQPGVE